METFLIKAAQLIVAFAILVIIHEFGHYIFSRIFGVKVEKSIFSSILGLLSISINPKSRLPNRAKKKR